MPPTATKKITTVSEWKKAVPQGQEGKSEDLELPSGNVALVKRPGMREFLEIGIIPDSLTPLVEEAINKGKALKMPEPAELAKDPKFVEDVQVVMDRIVAYVVEEPPVLYRPESLCNKCLKEHREGGSYDHKATPHKRKKTNLYVDEVDVDDKVFIMNFAVGGTRDLERFRSELQTSVGGVQSRKAVSRPTKRAVRRKR